MAKLDINVWKTKHDNKETPIDALTDEELQKALFVVHKRQLANLNRIKIDEALERSLKKEANKREKTLVSLDLADNPRYSKEFAKKKPIIDTITNSLFRKEKQLEKSKDVLSEVQ